MNVLTPQQVQEIARIINAHIGVMVHVTTGQGDPDPALLRKLGLPSNAPSLIQNAFVLGKLMQMMKDSDLKNMTYDQLKEKAKTYRLSTVERNSLEYAQQHAAQYVTALGNKITTQIQTKIAQAGQQVTAAIAEQDIIRDTVAQGILLQQTRGKVASELGHADGDWMRDWQRVAQTEIWNAKLQGEVITILQGQSIYANTKKGDTLVFRRPSPDACVHCKRLLLEADGVTPKVFKLSELMANGTNVGLKVADWKPVTGTIHPNCTCPIAVLPDGFGFDANGELVFKG